MTTISDRSVRNGKYPPRTDRLANNYRNNNMPPNKIPTLTVWLLVSSSLSAAPTSETLPEEPSSVMPFLVFGVAAIVVGVLLITGLTLWSRKQDEITNMMYFCIDSLINTRNKTKRYRAAKELGRTKNPGALLVLIDVINDESAEEGIRKAAGDALLEMSQKYRRFKRVIRELLAATEDKDHERVVELLKTHFEHEEKEYVQSAYVIGRELVRLKKYADAREWLRIAEVRNRKFPMYLDQIRALTAKCNRHLCAEGDMAFKAGDFHLANERFALAAHGLSLEVSNQFAYYLRAACVYCKLEEFENASQAILQALHHDQETDTALELNKLVNKLLNLVRDNAQAKEEHQNLSNELDRFVNQTMDSLSTRHSQIR
jgi:tetratricopeptide (TPR) repeat protein